MSLPVPNDRRVPNYLRQSGRPELTPRQRRRAEQKKARLDNLTGQHSPGPARGR
ncbi:hypothetical protein ACFY2R_25860 [Micromonospora olivasterospora]|uniref:Uncharacterized protein n=1 Tax=Micromonospora olivasterospora TaxID=1880 RepID=A0A562ICU5_MICOL|nr:hypothetical protein [Micromonospora olivasterospora]TWH68839.1 hypothetical protein JD77_03840 [Micromonospora olivasterospora]